MPKTSSRNRNRLLCVIAVWAAACSGDEAPSAAPVAAADPVVVEGMVTATYTRYWRDSGNTAQFDVVALFPRYRQQDGSMVAAMLDDRIPDVTADWDRCDAAVPLVQNKKTVPRHRRLAALLDGGDLVVSGGGHTALLTAFTYPDLLKTIEGVVYGTGARFDVAYVPEETYRVSASGSDVIGAFDVFLAAPPPFAQTVLNGDGISSGRLRVFVDGVNTLRWQPGETADEVVLTLRWYDMGMEWWMPCRLRDDGFFTWDSRGVESMRALQPGTRMEVTLARVRQSAFRARGVSYGVFTVVAQEVFSANVAAQE